jgi:hypothetical protein
MQCDSCLRVCQFCVDLADTVTGLPARFSLFVIGERLRGGRKPRSRSIQLGCGSLSLGSYSAPGLERFRERVKVLA